MDTAALDLARFQFAFVISVHIIFPAITIGLASYLAVLDAAWLWTGEDTYLNVFNYWLRIFAIVFGMGVVSGIVMSYQFGTNWSVFSDKTGPVLGPLMGYEVLTAFFLEAGFLGVMLFGLKRVGPKLHFVATLMVAAGTLLSAFWILSANSWMQTPAGHAVNAQGQFVPVDWWRVVFNPSFPYRLVHMVLAAYLSTAFVVGAVGAFHLLKDNSSASAKLMFSMALWMAIAVTPVQIIAGDQHGLNTLEYQPMKIAAMEGHYDTHEGAPLILFGLPDNKRAETRYALEVPKLGSYILTHDWNGKLRGLKEWPKSDWPNAPLIFWTFRIMVGIGLAHARHRHVVGADRPPASWLCVSPLASALVPAMGRVGLLALLAGWIVDRNRPPRALHRLRAAAHRRSRLADRSDPARRLAPCLHGRLSRQCSAPAVSLVSAAADVAATRKGVRGPDPGRRVPRRRYYARSRADRGNRRVEEARADGDRPAARLGFADPRFAVFAYVVLDGFDLGIGILVLAVQRRRGEPMHRENSVAPVWDGNETWLVLGGGGLMAALPARLCRRAAGPLCAAHRDVARSCPSRRRLRVPLAGQSDEVPVGLGVRNRLDGRCSCARHYAWRPDPGRESRRPRLCRRVV